MARRRIGQEYLRLGDRESGRTGSLDDLHRLIDWAAIDRHLAPIYASAKGEQAWPPLSLFKALLLAVWYDLSDVKLAEALDDRASFRRFCGFAAEEPTPERTAFVRFRRALLARDLDRVLFAAVTDQLDARGVVVKTLAYLLPHHGGRGSVHRRLFENLDATGWIEEANIALSAISFPGIEHHSM